MAKDATPFKAQYGWSVRAMLPITPAGAGFFYRHHVSPNAVSVLSLIAFLAGLYVYVVGSESTPMRLLASCMFALGTYLDVVDGYVARLTGTTGKSGAYVDAGIDLIRYNLFFLAVYAVVPMSEAVLLSLVVYAILLNVSFIRLLRNIGRGIKVQESNAVLDELLPAAYKGFCQRWQLLYSPVNLEDQLLFFLFVLGVVGGIEPSMIVFCAAVRVVEALLVLFGRLRLADAQ